MFGCWETEEERKWGNFICIYGFIRKESLKLNRGVCFLRKLIQFFWKSQKNNYLLKLPLKANDWDRGMDLEENRIEY